MNIITISGRAGAGKSHTLRNLAAMHDEPVQAAARSSYALAAQVMDGRSGSPAPRHVFLDDACESTLETLAGIAERARESHPNTYVYVAAAV